MLKYFYIAFVILLIWIVLFVNKLLPVPLFQTQQKVINTSWESKAPFENADTLSYAFIYITVRDHYNKPAYQNAVGGLYFRDDLVMENYFLEMVPNSYPKCRNAGRFGQALIYKQKKNYDLMLEELDEITIKDVPFYHCELGWALTQTGHFSDAIKSFEKELTYKNGNKSSAYEGLAELLFYLKDFESIHRYASDPMFVKECPDYVLRNEYFYNGPIVSYLKLVMQINGDWYLVIAAAFIALLWAYYYTRFKLFAPKDYFIYIVVFAISCLFSLLCVLLYDVLHLVLHVYEEGNFWGDMFYFIFGVGIIEEFTKALPVLLCVLAFSKRIKEPVDYLILATVSALGFAFMENIVYFDLYYGNLNFSIIHKRGVLAVILHVFCSTVIWYGYIQTKLLKNMKHVLLAIIVSIAVHGLYDLFLSSSVSSVFYLYSFAMVVLSFFILKMFYNNALNQSPLFDARIGYPSRENAFILVAGLGMIFVFEFVIEAIRFGAPHANDSLLTSLLAYTIIVLLYSSNISSIVLCNRYWLKLKDVFVSNFSQYRTVGTKVSLVATKKSANPNMYPLQGTIVNLELLGDIPDNYAIQLTHPLVDDNRTVHTIIACLAAKTTERHKVQVRLLLETNVFLLSEDGGIDETKYKHLDYCAMETSDVDNSIVPPIQSNWKGVIGLIVVFILFLVSFTKFMNYTSAIEYVRGAERSLEVLDIYSSSTQCRAALHFNEDNYEARMLFAKIRVDGGFYVEALTYLGDENVQAYIAPDYYALKGVAYFKLNVFDQALESFKKCEQYDIQFDSLYWYESCAYEKLKNLPEAIKAMNIFLSNNNSHISKDAYIRIADLYFNHKMYTEAYVYYDKLVQIKEFYAQALLMRGLCNHHLNKLEASCIDIETANSYGSLKAIDYLNLWCRLPTAEDSLGTPEFPVEGY
jgi:RsiW-degrading membrane proteinase PrsW (M82 family)